VNKNTLWADEIFKEMCGLRRLNVFNFHLPNHKCDRKDGWQFAPMHMIFDIKQPDMRYKARLVVGIMTGDIGNAFPTAPCAEKVWSKCGPKFGDQEGTIITLQQALYGLKMASRSFHEFFGDTLRRMGFVPTCADQDLWYRK
jgi:hypothetical protein